MAVILSTKDGVYYWNLKGRTPIKKFASTGSSSDGIISTTLSPDGLPSLWICD